MRENVINYFQLLFSNICEESEGFKQESVSLNFTIVTVDLGRYIVLYKTAALPHIKEGSRRQSITHSTA